ncbi:interferon regulatory factor 9 isoform X3 [Anas platyrhynchos]|uniref:interferon regulatory factor 9 isoform X3 n=1 Tax=Anas platyrhynchos TaxID=8839 RepID=UPI003AF1EF08
MTSGRRRLLPWLLAQAQSGRFPGLEFDDAARSALRVPWERAGRGGAGGGAAAALCQAWAEYKGATPPPGPAVCKTRLRCALHKSPELQEVPERARLDGPRPYKVYRLLGPRPPRNGPAPRRGSKGRKEEAEPRGDDATPPPSPEEEEEEAEPSPAPPPPAAVTPPPSRQLAILLDSPEPLPPAEELQRHRQGLGPPPEHRVLLAATPGELRTGGGASAQGAVLQLEQALAQRLLGPAPDPAN